MRKMPSIATWRHGAIAEWCAQHKVTRESRLALGKFGVRALRRLNAIRQIAGITRSAKSRDIDIKLPVPDLV